MNKPTQITSQSNWFSSDIVVSPSEAASLIVQGSEARKTAKEFLLPKDSELKESFAEKVKDAYSSMPETASLTFDVAKDVYAGLMSKKGNLTGEYDDDVWSQAINIASGGIHDFNGRGNVILPWGMSSDEFDNLVNKRWKNEIAPSLGRNLNESFGLESLSDSKYFIKSGSSYLPDRNGNPVIIDLTREKIRDIPL